ncbi:MAG: DNA-binding protein [Acidobacteria bacterium]|nr:DNA-binding protein [Acidobacteriota bacterium]
MQIAIELSEQQEERLEEHARRLGVEPQALATAAVVDLLNREAEDFSKAAEYVVAKNRELYRRLS